MYCDSTTHNLGTGGGSKWFKQSTDIRLSCRFGNVLNDQGEIWISSIVVAVVVVVVVIVVVGAR